MTKEPGKNMPGAEAMKEYFNILKYNKRLHVCIVTDEKKDTKVYMERPKNEDGVITPYVIRVFFRVNDMITYGNYVLEKNKSLDPDGVRKLSMDTVNLVDYISKLDKSRKKTGKTGIRSIVTTIEDNGFCDVDIFWTSEPEIML